MITSLTKNVRVRLNRSVVHIQCYSSSFKMRSVVLIFLSKRRKKNSSRNESELRFVEK